MTLYVARITESCCGQLSAESPSGMTVAVTDGAGEWRRVINGEPVAVVVI